MFEIKSIRNIFIKHLGTFEKYPLSLCTLNERFLHTPYFRMIYNYISMHYHSSKYF